MAITFDAASNVGTPVGTALSWTHTPSGTPRAVVVFVVQNVGTADEVTGVTYGGTAMTEVTGSPNIHGTGEPGVVYAYFLGSSVPTGAQTVVVSVNGTGSIKTGTALTYTASQNVAVEAVDATINSDSAVDPSVSLVTRAGITTAVAIGLHSGQQQATGITPLSGWTSRLEFDYGSQNAGVYTLDTNGTGGNITAGWTQTAEDAVAIALALMEVALTISTVSDTVSLSDSATATRMFFSWAGTTNLISQPAPIDALTLSDSVIVLMADVLPWPSVVASVTITDEVTLHVPISAMVAENVLLTESLRIGTGLFITAPDPAETLSVTEWTSQEIVGVSSDINVDFAVTKDGLVTVHLIYRGASNQVHSVIATNSSGKTMRFTVKTPFTQEFVNIPDGVTDEEFVLGGNIKVIDGTSCGLRVA